MVEQSGSKNVISLLVEVVWNISLQDMVLAGMVDLMTLVVFSNLLDSMILS